MSQTKAQLIDPVDGTIVNADINASAAIAGSKISPDFGSQNIVTTGGLTVDTTTFHVDSSNNRVGIGTTSPEAPLHEKITTSKTNSIEHMLILEHLSSGTTTTGFGTGIRFRGERNNGVMQNIGDIEFEADVNSGSTISAALVFKPGVGGVVTERMRIDSSGNVGIGTTSPVRHLHLNGSDSDTVQLHITNSTTGTTGSDGVSFALGSDESLIINQRESNHIALKTADTERVRIDSSGNLTFSMEASSGYPTQQIKWSNDSTTANGFYIAQHSDRNGRIWHEQGLDLVFGTNNTERMRIDVNGQVGINDTSPVAELSVAAVSGNAPHIDIGQAGSNSFKLGYEGNNCFLGAASSTGMFLFKNNVNSDGHPQATGTERLRIDSIGRLLIGTTSPLMNESGFAEIHLSGKSEGGAIHMEDVDQNVQGGFFTSDLTGGMIVRTRTNHPLIFRTNNTERGRFTTDNSTFLVGQTSAGADANGWTLRGDIQTSSVKFTSTDVRTMFFMSSYHSTGSQDTKFAFHSNGEMNATNTTIQPFSSERRTKKNIVALNLEKAWNTLRDTPFYTFNFKDEIEGTRLHHGPIVDECPEDLIVPTQKEDEVGIINTVNTEKLQYRAYSALQQALKRIETLESEVATLKAA